MTQRLAQHPVSGCAKRVETVQNSPFDWPAAREAIKQRLGHEAVGRWIDPLSVASVTEETVVLAAPNPFFRDWVNAHYLEPLKQLIEPRELQIVVPESTNAPGEGRGPAVTLPAPTLPAPRPERSVGSVGPPSDHALNPRFTFHRFVVGPSNRFAHAASLAVGESPAKAYNPLFIYGGVGLGKTHLMQAIGQTILQRGPGRRVVYVSSEAFTNELITAIQTKTTARFRERYRTVDVLLIDDIHFIGGKEATQEEFFHTFNTLYDAHKQIVLSSDRPPKEIAGLEERLVSRFEWGLVTDIQSPDLETRIAIVRKKAEETSLDVPHEVTDFIASQVTSNIRELEGALIRVIAYCNLFNEPLSAAIAQTVLSDMVKEMGSRVTIELIQQRVAAYFQLDRTTLRGTSRQRAILYPRQLAMFLCRKLTDASFPEIGREFGGRDHTTVMHAVDKIGRETSQDMHKKRLVEHLSQTVISASQHQRSP